MTMRQIHDEWTRGERSWGEVEELVEACVCHDPNTSLEPFDAALQVSLRTTLEQLASIDSQDDIAMTAGAERVLTEAAQRDMRHEFWVRHEGAREWLRRHPK
jgi:uncharacterized membrane protein